MERDLRAEGRGPEDCYPETTEAGGQVDPLVSLRITDNTKLTQKAVMFGEATNGYFFQQYTLYADDNKTGVSMKVEGHIGKNDTTRTFFVGDNEFNEVKDAFIAAGHEWLKASFGTR